ncbi:hypothetical protein [Oceanicola sp. S124]|uniref:hypothetical protein n=1 Tax=Oceanicola sp. S124 TaxID=1042378 RepID=UPI000255A971|nr:hypothetical protein [Oceanicola sp. S124]
MTSPEDHLQKLYRNGDTYYRVIGYIDRPALHLEDPITGKRAVVVIDSPQHRDMKEIEAGEALLISERQLPDRITALRALLVKTEDAGRDAYIADTVSEVAHAASRLADVQQEILRILISEGEGG